MAHVTKAVTVRQWSLDGRGGYPPAFVIVPRPGIEPGTTRVETSSVSPTRRVNPLLVFVGYGGLPTNVLAAPERMTRKRELTSDSLTIFHEVVRGDRRVATTLAMNFREVVPERTVLTRG